MTPPKTPEQEMTQRWHNVFGTAEGHIVLGHIATIFHFFDAVDPNDIVMNTQRSCALVILQLAGAFDTTLYPQLGLGKKEQ